MYTYLPFSDVSAIDQSFRNHIVQTQMPDLKWRSRKHDKFPERKKQKWEEFVNTQNGLIDEPEVRFFMILANLYDTGGIYLDLTTMMLEPLPEVCIPSHQQYGLPPWLE